jgi:hypothetical protein
MATTYSIFGLPGSPIIPVLHDIDVATRVRFVNLGHEDLNGHAACVYGDARRDGVPGTLLCTHGPGLASCVNAIAGARKEKQGLVVVSVCESERAAHDFQYWETEKILSAIIGEDAVYVVRSRGDEVLRAAYMDAQTRRRPVAVLFVDLEETGPNYVHMIGDVVHGLGKTADPREVTGQNIKARGEPEEKGRTAMQVDSQAPVGVKVVEAIQPRQATEATEKVHVTAKKRQEVTTKKEHTEVVRMDTVTEYYDSGTQGKDNAIVIIDKHTVGETEMLRTFMEGQPGLHYATTFGGRVNLNLAENTFLGVIEPGMVETVEAVILLNYDADSEAEGPHFFHQKYGVPSLAGKRVVRVTNQTLQRYGPQGVVRYGHTSRRLKGYKIKCSRTNMGYWEDDMEEAYAGYCARREGEASHIVVGIGDFGYAVGAVLEPRYPSHFFASTKWGSIGIGVPTGVGVCAALADTDTSDTKRTIFVYEGDGSLLWASAAALLLPSIMKTELGKNTTMIVTVFCNGTYGAVKEGMEADVFRTEDSTYETVRVATVPRIEGEGVATYECETWAEYKEVMEQISTGTVKESALYVLYCYV